MTTTPSLSGRTATPFTTFAIPAMVGAVCALIYLLTAAYGTVSGDVAGTQVLSWQLATTGDSTFTEETFPPLQSHPLRDTWITESSDGREVIARFPGAVIAAIPAYWVFGGDTFSAAPGAATAAVITACAVFMFALTLRPHLSPRETTLAALTFGLSTPVWSVAADGMWTHTITVVGICGMALAASRDRWWLVGLFGGVAIWGRPHAAIIVALVGLLVGSKRRDLGLAIRVGIGSGSLLALDSLWTKTVYGSWNPLSPYGLSVSDNPFVAEGNGLVNQLGFLVSLDRGLLVWSPLIVLLLPALWGNWRRLPDWSRAFVWCGLVYTLVQGMRSSFEGGDGFYGYRLTLELLTCLAPALALSAHSMGSYARRAVGPVLAFQTVVIGVGAINARVVYHGDGAWTTHILLSALAQRPLILLGFLGLCLGLGILGQRIWNNPSLERAATP